MKSPLLNSTFLSLFALLLLSGYTRAQNPANGNKQYSSTYANLQDTGKVMDIRERLVQLALQNPTFEIADRKVVVADYQIRKAKGSWLSALQAAGNLNEFSLKGNSVAANLFPKYNFGVSIPFDIFTSKGNDVKIAKENFSIAQAEKNQRFREIKAEVLTRYEDYLMYKQMLELQSQSTQDAQSVYLQSEKDFADGFIKQEDYNKATKAYNEERSRQAGYQRNFNVVKIELEKLIGVPLETVLALTK
jgi:outer membrane protein TolC